MIDLHCHVLPGIDDGPATIEGSLAIARAAAAAGTRALVATPHVSSRYRNDPETIAGLTDTLRGELQQEGIALDIRPGAELALSHLLDLDGDALARFGLGGGPWLLVEPPFTSFAADMDRILHDLQHHGHHIVLAHPERCTTFQRDPQMLEGLVRSGVVTSVTAGSLVGRFGSDVRRFALGMVGAELVHNVASDAHDPERRGPGIASELHQAGLGGLLEWLTIAVPEAILGGEETIPRRPAATSALSTPARVPWWQRVLRRA